MEKWISFTVIIISTIPLILSQQNKSCFSPLNPANNRKETRCSSYTTIENRENCIFGPSPIGGKKLTCSNITVDHLKNDNFTLNRAHWLECKKCNLTQIDNTTFNLPKNNLNYLLLGGSHIKSIGSFSFSKFPLLKVLSLSNNDIDYLDVQAFYGNKKLLQLDLKDNKLTTLIDNLFVDLEKLDILNLNNNSITLIGINAFSGLKNLKYLYLNHNNLTSLEANMFRYLVNLKILYLENNKIQYVHPLTFNKMGNLNYLYLNKNRITYLVQYHFKPLEKLVDLQLRFNNLTEIQTSTFNGLKNIKFLYLGENSLRSVKPYGFIGLNSLEILDLIGNQFEFFTLDYFKDMLSLKTVWLENNSIGNFSISRKSDTQPSLTTLDLMENQLEFINYKHLYEKVPKIQEIWVTNNPWDCDFFKDMFHFFRAKGVTLCSNTNCNLNSTLEYMEELCYKTTLPVTEDGVSTDFSTDSAFVSDACGYLVFTTLALSRLVNR